MPRGAFDITVEFIQGPGGTSPGASRGEADARFVEANGIFQSGAGHPEIVGWITIADYEPRGSWTVSAAGFKPSLSDDVIIGDDSEATMWVAFVEHVDWEDQPDYFRASVCFLPRPDECSCSGIGGANCEEAEGVEIDVAVEGTLLDGLSDLWYKITLPPGDYHLTFLADGGAHAVTVWTGPCGDLVGEMSLLGDGCDVWSNEEAGDVVYTIRVHNVTDDPVDFTFTIGEGDCP